MKEQTKTKTLKELFYIDQLVGQLYKKDEKLRDTKFGYCYKRFVDKNLIPVMKERNEKIQDIQISNALDNKDTGEVITDHTNSRGFKYSKESLKKCIKEENELIEKYSKKEIKVEPFISSYVPLELSDEEREMLSGILI